MTPCSKPELDLKLELELKDLPYTANSEGPRSHTDLMIFALPEVRVMVDILLPMPSPFIPSTAEMFIKDV